MSAAFWYDCNEFVLLYGLPNKKYIEMKDIHVIFSTRKFARLSFLQATARFYLFNFGSWNILNYVWKEVHAISPPCNIT